MRSAFLAAALAVLGAAVVCAQQGSVTKVEGAKAAAPQKSDKKDKKGRAAVEEYKPQASEYGQKAKCPVSGEEFKVGPDTKAVKYKGKTYYFCCPSCMPAFKKTPAKFAR